MRLIDETSWKPADGLILEDEAMRIAKSNFNSLVIAGPGAGKTELLAQRASFLLETNSCAYPRKILAISFKKDAAHNLKQRVRLRCGDGLTNRFDSYTFDAFAKQILDRFRTALPNEFKIHGAYKIVFDENAVLDEYRSQDISTFNSEQEKALLKHHHAFLFAAPTQDKLDLLRHNVWKALLARPTSILTFKMVMSLARHILDRNPKLTTFLQQTYSHVFLDEFQDTTDLQYSFFTTCFLACNSVTTAVGDDKQMIMRWAGADQEILNRFVRDTSAERTTLVMNFRSAPKLVSLQNYLIQHLLGKTDFAQSSDHWDKNAGESTVMFFDDPIHEANVLFTEIQNWIQNEGVSPRDICILVKQQLPKYAAAILSHLNSHGIKARDESALQDLIANEICQFVVDVLFVCFGTRQQEKKLRALMFLSKIKTEVIDYQILQLENEFNSLIDGLRKSYSDHSDVDLGKVVNEIVDFAGRDRICAVFISHCRIEDLNELVESLIGVLNEYFVSTKSVTKSCDALLGMDTIPVMTIHKSKGLEYHSIVFLGLEDSAFWSYSKQADEDKNAFFVALSRAKQRVVFTFSKLRNGRYNRMEQQSLGNIEELFKHLEDSKLVSFVDNSN